MLYVKYIDINASETKVFVDGEHALSVVDDRQGLLSWDFEVTKASSTNQFFVLQSSGYYRSTAPTLTSYTYSIARIDFDMRTEAEVEIAWKRYVSSYSYGNECFGIISNVDTELAASGTSSDSSSSIFCYVGNTKTSTLTGTTKVTIPAGKHFLHIKYRYGNYYAGSNYFEFKINTPCPDVKMYDVSHLFPTYGNYNVQAQSYADGFTESDLVTIGYNYRPVIEVNNDILSVVNHVPNGVTGFEVYINGALKDTIAYDGSTGFSVDLTTYGANAADEYDVYVVAIGEGVPENQSDELHVKIPEPYYSVDTVNGASYGFAWDSSLGYYVSQNKGINNSAALCKVTFNTQGKHLYIDCINYAEANYDYGILSKIDQTPALDITNTADSTYFKRFYGSNSSSVQTVDYGVVAAGEHFIYIKFRKDSGGQSGNDQLRFKVRFE